MFIQEEEQLGLRGNPLLEAFQGSANTSKHDKKYMYKEQNTTGC